MFNRKSYPVVPTPPEQVRELRASGLSMTRIARHLHISPAKFKERVENSLELQKALDKGAAEYQTNKAAIAKENRVTEWDDDAEFETTVPLKPLDEIILNAIAAGTCDRPSIERLLNPRRTPQIQITPSLERLLQHGKINVIPPRPGVILTKYEPAETATDAPQAGPNN